MRFNIFGGPGSGKSVTAAYIYTHLKIQKRSVELIQEYCKAWAYMKREVQEFDEIYFFGKQIHHEERLLRSGVKNIITDSPVLLPAIYSKIYYNSDISKHLEGLAREFQKKYPYKNIFLKRNDDFFSEEGRFQDLKEAKKIDGVMKKFLNPRDTFYVDPEDRETLTKIVERYSDV